MSVVERCHQGQGPLVISFPHVGTVLPESLWVRLTPAAQHVPDTDWHVHRLYDFAATSGASWLQPRFSRYLIDLNRPPDDAALYPGQAGSGLCPREEFDGTALYQGEAPDAAEIMQRRQHYWQPYHDALRQLINAARQRCGHAVLLDAHSIRSHVPRLFPGRLPDLNIGTNDGRSCDPRLRQLLQELLRSQSAFTHVVDGRFKGGYITRAYGQPDQSVHAVQIELAQSAYMDEPARTGAPMAVPTYVPERAAALRHLLQDIIRLLQTWKP